MSEHIRKIAGNLRLGEGCIWDEKRRQVHFLDIEGNKLYSYSPESGNITEWNMGDYVGCVVLDEQDNLVTAVGNQLLRFCPESGKREVLLRIPFSSALRFNDGKCDAHGNLWVGTMAIHQSLPMAEGAGSLYCVNKWGVITRYDGFTIPNGMDWSGDGSYFYHIDTQTQKIDRYDMTGAGGLARKCTAVEIEPCQGSPDGMCMDAMGHLWVAMWGGYGVNCYDPESGRRLHEIRLPDQLVSCCAFGGEHLDELYITTAAGEEGNGGGLYVVKLEGQKGKRSNRFG